MIEDLGVAAPKTKTPGWVKIIMFGLLVIMLGQLADFIQNSNIRKEQEAGQVRGYLNRAVTCDLAKAIGSSEPEGCTDPAIQKYRDENLTPDSTAGARASNKTAELVCFVLQQSARRNPDMVAIPPDFCPPD